MPATPKVLFQLLFFAGLTSLGFFANGLQAHPVPKFEFDRELSWEVQGGTVTFVYRLEIDLSTLYHEVGRKGSPFAGNFPADATREDFARRMQERLRKIIPDRITWSRNGQKIPFEPVKEQLNFLDSIQFEFHYRLLTKDLSGDWLFQDGNFLDRTGCWLLPGMSPPGESVTAASRMNLSRTWHNPFEAPETRPALSGSKAVEKQAPLDDATEELAGRRRLPLAERLLFSRNNTLILLGLAFFFGAAHALTPGHGKTLVAAYLVGEKGTYRQAILLGLSTTVSHTGGVLLVAGILWYFYPQTPPEQVQQWLGFVGGLLMAGLGFWILSLRLAGRADHYHPPEVGQAAPYRTVRIILLGLAGGIIPCWDAVLLLGLAIACQKMALAVPLLVAFSLGLASVLVAIGLLIVRWQKRLADRPTNGLRSQWLAKLVTALPVVSALLVIALGFWLAADSVASLPEHTLSE